MGIFSKDEEPSWSDVIHLEKQVKELKAENEALIVGLGVANKYVNKYQQTLQEIKEIAEQSNVDCIYRISVIRKILTKAEEE